MNAWLLRFRNLLVPELLHLRSHPSSFSHFIQENLRTYTRSYALDKTVTCYGPVIFDDFIRRFVNPGGSLACMIQDIILHHMRLFIRFELFSFSLSHSFYVSTYTSILGDI